MIEYSVRYRARGRRWTTLHRVKGDALLPEGLRVFILSDERRVEVSIVGAVFEFPKERFYRVKENMEAEAGQAIPLRPK